MQFPGYWVGGDGRKVTVSRAIFDETDLSEESGWKEAHQNKDSGLLHGYVEWESALADVRGRLGISS